MVSPLAYNHPFFSNNTLMTTGNDSQQGLYNFLVDLIASTDSIKEVKSFHSFHEVIHRASSNYGRVTNSFSLLRKLGGISHVLLMKLMTELQNSKGTLEGKKLAELVLVGGSSQENETINSLLQRISFLENIVDMGWRGILPVAELIAIDFSHDLNPNNYFYYGWDIEQYYSIMQKGDTKGKLNQLMNSIRGVPKEYGGYFVKYGSFSAALEQAFKAYDSIPNNFRFPILESALHILYQDSKGQLIVNDPLEVIFWATSIARTKPQKEAIDEIVGSRVLFANGGRVLAANLSKVLLRDISPNISSYKNLSTAITLLMLEQKIGRLDKRTKRMFGADWVETLSRSFMRIHLTKSRQQTVLLNPNFIVTAHQRILGYTFDEAPDRTHQFYLAQHPQFEQSKWTEQQWTDEWQQLGLETDWWRKLALLQAVRDSLKSGIPLTCPFKNWRFQEFDVDILKNYPLNCHEKCFIRVWINKLEKKVEFIAKNGYCVS